MIARIAEMVDVMAEIIEEIREEMELVIDGIFLVVWSGEGEGEVSVWEKGR